MKKLFLVSYFAEVAELFDRFEETYRNKIVCFIPTAALTESVNFYVEDAKHIFEERGFLIEELDVFVADTDEIYQKLERADYIYVSGGNTFFLLQELKNKGADKMIVDQVEAGKVYIGESAGAMIATPDISYAKVMDDCEKAPQLKNYEGLGLVKFAIIPHYGEEPFAELTVSMAESMKENYKAIGNRQAILVCGNETSIDEIDAR